MTAKNRNKILLIHPKLNTFVSTDYEILSKSNNVQLYHYIQSKKMFQNLVQQFYLLVWILKNSRNLHCLYIWFADYHSFLPVLYAKLFHKKSYLILGGYDTANLQDLDYGSFKNPIRAFCARFSIKNVTLNLPVSDFIKEEALSRVPGANIETLSTGYSPTVFFHNGKEKEPIILTIGVIDSLQRLKLKGIDFSINVAKKLPEFMFLIIGMNEEIKNLLTDIPSNVQIIESIDHQELVKYYQKSKVYIQFSMREGLPNTVCEAMLCECIPVGFNNGGIPEAIGDAGYLLSEQSLDKAADLLKRAMVTKTDAGKKARKYIIDNFTIEKREKRLLQLVKTTSNPKSI